MKFAFIIGLINLFANITTLEAVQPFCETGTDSPFKQVDQFQSGAFSASERFQAAESKSQPGDENLSPNGGKLEPREIAHGKELKKSAEAAGIASIVHSNFRKEVIDETAPVLVLVTAPEWCPTCNIIHPKFEEAARDSANKNIKFKALYVGTKKDVTDAGAIPKALKILNADGSIATPTVLLIKKQDGELKVLTQFSGYKAASLSEILDIAKGVR